MLGTAYPYQTSCRVTNLRLSLRTSTCNGRYFYQCILRFHWYISRYSNYPYFTPIFTPIFLPKPPFMGVSKFFDLIAFLASVRGAVIQATVRTELEDGMRLGVCLKRLQAHCGVCTSPIVMLNPLWGMAWLWGGVGAIISPCARPNSNCRGPGISGIKLQLVWC